jgi:kojibiose phosphorylase
LPHRPFALVVFDWDGTAVRDRQEDASELRARLLALMEHGVAIVVITGTNIRHVASQLALEGSRLPRGRLYAATNRGSEVYAFTPDGRPERIVFRQATPAEDEALDRIATSLQAELQQRTGLPIAAIFDRLNRRKIDLIPEPDWRDPLKARIGELLVAVQSRFEAAGLSDGLGKALEAARRLAREAGLPEARITSDVKHVEVGLTDKGDSMAWVLRDLAPAMGIPTEAILVGGDEFGPLAGFLGSDSQMRLPEAVGATFVSVGREPNGVPDGVLHLGGGPAGFKALLAELATLKLPALPTIFIPTMDPTWQHRERGFLPQAEHEVESRFALSNGTSGTRGSLMEQGPYSRGGTFLAGVFDPGRAGFDELVIAPFWPALTIEAAGERLCLDAGEYLLHCRTLDMRRGMLLRAWRHRSPEGRITRIHEARWASLADRHAFFQEIWLVPENYSGPLLLVGTLNGEVRDLEGEIHLEPVRADASPLLVLRTRHSGIALAFAGTFASLPPVLPQPRLSSGAVEQHWSFSGRLEEPLLLRRAVVAYTGRDTPDPAAAARTHADNFQPLDLEGAAAAHSAAWRDWWEAADVRIEGDPAAQKALRFALFQLIGSADAEDPRVSIGARALTGEGYKGHVFWDTELYMLPFYLHTYPPSARTLLMYRYHTLEAARQRARALGYQGALYAWESTDTGEEATPETVIGFDGELVPILTGKMAHHIDSAVAYAVWKYWQSTQDEAFMAEAGCEILLEVARFWASRVEPDAAGAFHIRHVVGPDEYHPDVDDSAYTNEMARFCLNLGAQVASWLAQSRPAGWASLAERLGFSDAEVAAWPEVARRLVTGFDPARGIHEQFAGYFQLREVPLAPYATRSIPMDLILGHETVKTQIVKQADVVMLMRLLWDFYPPEVRAANFAYYEPRTGHGSSLSPGVHALVAAKLRQKEQALEYFRFAAEIDLGNRMGNSSEGVHAAALGLLWQAAVFGFGGLHVHEDALMVDPAIPETWGTLTFPFHYRGMRLHVTVTPTELAIDCPGPVPLRLGAEGLRELGPGLHRARFTGGTWTWMASTSP